MTDLLTLDDLGDLDGKRVFVRVDFNVPISEDHKVLDDTRLREAEPTIRELTSAGAIVILASHLGRPKGKRDPRYTLRPVADHLRGLVGSSVRFATDCVGPEALDVIRAMDPGEVVLLENLRFYAGE